MRGLCRRACGARAAAALLVLAALALRLPRSARLSARLPHHSPAALAHALADFSNHPSLDPDIGAWSVEEEAGNGTRWWYRVTFSCGARCGGRAEVSHSQPPAHARDRGHSHRLRVRDERCAPLLPLLPWPRLCEEWDTDISITRDPEGGTRLEERTTRWAALAARAWANPAPRLAHIDALLPAPH